MIARVDAYVLKNTGGCQALVWQALSDFSSKRWAAGADALMAGVSQFGKDIALWSVAFDFCRLAGQSAALEELTEKYAALFGKPPPEWVSVAAGSSGAPPTKGLRLKIHSLSGPESEQYEAVRDQLEADKTAILFSFTPGKAMSWQTVAVDRLASVINMAEKLGVPVFGENLDVPMEHIQRITADNRTDSDWAILFFCLRALERESEFEDEAMNFCMARGISPPSYTALPAADKDAWFGTLSAKPEQSSQGGSVAVVGALSNGLFQAQANILQYLKTNSSVEVDMQAVSHVDWTSAMDFAAMYDRVIKEGRALVVKKPSAVAGRMLLAAGVPANAIKDTVTC